MNALNILYSAMLKSWNVNIESDYRLSLLMGGKSHPIRVDDKDVYLGTNEVLNGITIGKVIFHPACESIMSKETEIFKVIRKLSVARLYEITQPIAQVAFAVAGKKSGKTLPGRMVDALAPFKEASKEVREDVLEMIKGISITLDGNGIDNRLITFNLVKGGKDNEDRHIYYTATPAYPYYDELVKFINQNGNKKPGDRVVFNHNKVDWAAVLLVAGLFEMVFPSVNDPSQHSYSATTADCARLNTYLQSYARVASEVNSFIGKFRKDFDSIGIYSVDLNWLAELENLGELKGLIPPMDYNNYNQQPDTSRTQQSVASDPYASLMNTARSVHQVQNGGYNNQPMPQGNPPPVPPAKPGESYLGCDYIPSNGLYEFKFQQTTGMHRIITLTEDNRIQSENIVNPALLATMGTVAPLGGNGNPLLAAAAQLLQSGMMGGTGGIPPLVGIGGGNGGWVRDHYSGQLVPSGQQQQQQWGGSAPLGTNDAWGSSSAPAVHSSPIWGEGPYSNY